MTIPTSKQILQGHQGPIYAVSFNKNWIYSSAGDRFVARWDVLTGKQDSFSIKLEKPAYCLATFSDFLFVGCTNGAVCCIDLSTKTMKWETNLFGQALFSLEYDNRNNHLIGGDSAGNLFILNETGQKKVAFQLDCGKIRRILCVGSDFYTGSQDGIIRVFDRENLNEKAVVPCHKGSVHSLVFDEGSNVVYSGGADGHVSMLNCLNFTQIKAIPAHYQSVYDLKIIGEQLISCSQDKSIKIWSLTPLKVIHKLTGGHVKSVNHCAVINTHRFVSVSDDKKLIIWEL